MVRPKPSYSWFGYHSLIGLEKFVTSSHSRMVMRKSIPTLPHMSAPYCHLDRVFYSTARARLSSLRRLTFNNFYRSSSPLRPFWFLFISFKFWMKLHNEICSSSGTLWSFAAINWNNACVRRRRADFNLAKVMTSKTSLDRSAVFNTKGPRWAL